MKRKSSHRSDRMDGGSEGSNGFFSIIKDIIVDSIKSRVKEGYEQAMDAIEERLLLMQRRLTRSIAVALFACAALTILLISGMFFLIDSLNLSRALSFLILGAAFAIVALILHLTRDNNRFQ